MSEEQNEGNAVVLGIVTTIVMFFVILAVGVYIESL